MYDVLQKKICSYNDCQHILHEVLVGLRTDGACNGDDFRIVLQQEVFVAHGEGLGAHFRQRQAMPRSQRVRDGVFIL